MDIQEALRLHKRIRVLSKALTMKLYEQGGIYK